MRRWFSPSIKAAIIRAQNGICGCGCGEELGTDPRDIEFDHVLAIWRGGEDARENLQALTIGCHRRKTREEAKARARTNRIRGHGGRRRMTAEEKGLAKLLGDGRWN